MIKVLEVSEQDSEQTQQAAHWDTIAQAYFAMGSPLMPCAEDTAAMSQFVAQTNAALGSRGVNALMWGVTPAIANLPWPTGSHLLAVDRSTEMLAQVWPGDIPSQRRSRWGEWLEPKVDPHVYDVVIGDGSFNCLEYPTQYKQLAAVTHDALQPDGALIARFFVKPAKSETVDTVFDALLRGQIGSPHAFKWRLFMAIMGEHATNIAVRDVYEVWQQANLDHARLLRATGWPATFLKSFDHYVHNDARYSFPSLPQVEESLAGLFELDQVYIPTYELGERCPIVRFKPKSARTLALKRKSAE